MKSVSSESNQEEEIFGLRHNLSPQADGMKAAD
jgi:hypothetical protein